MCIVLYYAVGLALGAGWFLVRRFGDVFVFGFGGGSGLARVCGWVDLAGMFGVCCRFFGGLAGFVSGGHRG